MRAAFLCLRLSFVLYWRKTVGAKAVRRPLMKLNPRGGCELKSEKWIIFFHKMFTFDVRFFLFSPPIYVYPSFKQHILLNTLSKSTEYCSGLSKMTSQFFLKWKWSYELFVNCFFFECNCCNFVCKVHWCRCFWWHSRLLICLWFMAD